MGYRIVRMSRELFEGLFVEGYTLPTRDGERLRVTKGLPEGARLDGVFADNLLAPGDGVILRFSHPSWENVAGERVPELQVTFSMETTTEFHRWHILPSLTPAAETPKRFMQCTGSCCERLVRVPEPGEDVQCICGERYTGKRPGSPG